MKKYRQLFLLVTFILGISTAWTEETYKVDVEHAEIGFAVSHLVISSVKGHFNEFKGSFVINDDGQIMKAEATIKAASIDTGIKKRDDHLRNADFFDAETYPEITLKNAKTEKRNGKSVLVGAFTIRDVTKELVLPYTIKGPVNDPWGNKKIGFEAKTMINRKDFGVAWNMKTETGDWVVGEEVELAINLEATKQETVLDSSGQKLR